MLWFTSTKQWKPDKMESLREFKFSHLNSYFCLIKERYRNSFEWFYGNFSKLITILSFVIEAHSDLKKSAQTQFKSSQLKGSVFLVLICTNQ